MDSHKTPDGRGATPTMLLLDEDWNEAGCFIERPPTLRDWIIENGSSMSSREVYDWKMEWYAEDSGHETAATFVAMLEAAAAGESLCS